MYKNITYNKGYKRYCFRTYPPKNPDHKLEGVDDEKASTIEHDKRKKTLQKSVIHYHPDKCDVEKNGKEWKVLSEEITKMCTRRYEKLK